MEKPNQIVKRFVEIRRRIRSGFSVISMDDEIKLGRGG